MSISLRNVKGRTGLQHRENLNKGRMHKVRNCKVVITANPNNVTSHLKHHLDGCSQRPTGVGIGEMRSDDGDDFVFNMNKLRNEIMLYIIEGAHLLATIEGKGFRRMTFKANLDFVLFSCSTTVRELSSMYMGG